MLTQRRGLAAVLGFAACAWAGAAQAEQIVLFDITYTHDASNDAHHGISGAALNQPNNWTSPIDYSMGTIHFYQEVMTKPSARETIIDFCLISARDYGCIETFIYTTTGLHETMRSMAGKDVDKRNVIDFTQKMRSIQMVLKTPSPTYINGGNPKSDFLPSKMRFVATLVSPGGTYMKPAPTPGFDPGDGGMPAPSDAGATVDAPMQGTGGSSGSGGSMTATGGAGGSASGGSAGGASGGSSGSSGGTSGTASGGTSGSSSSGGTSGSSSGGSSGSGGSKSEPPPSSSDSGSSGSALGCSTGGPAGGAGGGLLLVGLGLLLARLRSRNAA